MIPIDESKAPKSWRSYLTSRELSDLEALEANASDIDRKRRRLTAEITLWRNRGLQRRRHAQQQAAKQGLAA